MGNYYMSDRVRVVAAGRINRYMGVGSTGADGSDFDPMGPPSTNMPLDSTITLDHSIILSIRPSKRPSGTVGTYRSTPSLRNTLQNKGYSLGGMSPRGIPGGIICQLTWQTGDFRGGFQVASDAT